MKMKMKTGRNLLDLLFLIQLCCLLPTLIKGDEGLPQRDMSGLVGETISLPCDVDTEKCGDLHSIKWYRGSSRIFVFSEMAGIARSEGDYTERATLHYKPNDTVSRLEVKGLQVADEAMYKCEITYIEVRESCSVVQFINLTALIKPEYVKITRDDSTELQNASVIGPFKEGEGLTLTCESGGGKPIPSVAWYNGTHRMKGDYSTENGANSVGTGRNKIQLTLTRGDLRAKYECRAMNDALESPMVSWIKVDVHVRPLSLDLSGVEHHVVQGTKVLLECLVLGARPAANITWYNDTVPIREDALRTEEVPQDDGTFETRSTLVFTATRYENGEVISCEGENPVMQENHDKPLSDYIELEVLYPPIVSVDPENVTVNESTDILLFCTYEANPNTLERVTWLRDGEIVNLTPDHYEGGTIDQPTLLIKNSTRHDQGVYTCELENKVGSQESSNVVYVAVYFRPIVQLTMEPPTPVSELDRLNITLMCRVESGNPDILQAVRWYLDGELLKELPDCGGNATDYMFCDIDPSKLLLEDVGRSFHGNYSCEGMNEAGWGPLSPDEELIVYYPPGPATLTFEPTRVIKKHNVTLRCSVDDKGRPETTTYRWLRGTHHIPEVTTSNYTISTVTLETESNFTCLAYNEGGEGDPATVYIEVFAPPTFIERLPPYHGALVNASNIFISCRVECSPLCAVQWLKNGKLLNLNNESSQYTVNNTIIPPDSRTNDFESIRSILSWNMSAWPGGQLDRIYDSANYTCQSTRNDVGEGIKSSTIFRVEYPPENVTVSSKMVNVTEGHIPDRVICSATAFPEATYHWIHDKTDRVVKSNNALILTQPVLRKEGGNYTCWASNRHGNITQKTFINVLYKPECGIHQGEVDGKIALICTAHANPKEVDFTWRIKNENDTIEENIEKKGLQSILFLDSHVEYFRTYVCVANNSQGVSVPCERDVTLEISWWKKLDNEHLIIIIAIIVGAILMVLIVCIIIIIVCRRKRAEDKYPSPLATKDKSRPDLAGSPSNGLLQPDEDKTFYENLPFHGMQSAPNKSAPASFNAIATSRPSSQLSQYGSSGYGSTRSHVGPHLNNRSQSVTHLPKNRFSTLQTRTNKHGSHAGQPQFYSMRLRRKDQSERLLSSEVDGNSYKSQTFELHSMPIKENSPDSKSSAQEAVSDSRSELNNNSSEEINSNSNENQRMDRVIPPVPAPRKLLGNKSTKHTYQNVPIPITPNTQDPSPEQNRQQHQHHHHHHHHYNLTSSQHHLLLTPPNNTKTTSLNHLQQTSHALGGKSQTQPMYGSMRQSKSHNHNHHHNSSSSSASINNRTYLPPMRLEYQQPYYVAEPYVTDSIVYADLALAANGRREPHLLPHYRAPQNSTEYAILKFHDVGQEIDV